MILYGNINNKNGYMQGIIGGLLGGLICSLPWLFIGTFLSSYSFILSGLIPYGVIKGYRLIGGKIDYNMKKIVYILSIICVVIICLIFNPLLILHWKISLLNFYYRTYYILILRDLITSALIVIASSKYIMNRLYI